MRQCYSGSSANTTAAVQDYLNNTSSPLIYDLYIIGPPENPNSLWLTNYDSPLIYGGFPGETFFPATIKRDQVTSKIGLSSQSLTITYTPPPASAGTTTATATPYQLAAQHFYDNWPVQIYRAFMPTPGDINTLGITDWYGGRVQNCKIARNSLIFNTKDYMDVLSQKVPSTVIEVTNTLASTAATTLPAGDTSIPTFQCFTGSTETQIYADCLSPTADRIYAGDLFAGGYMIFLAGTGATLAGAWSGIAANGSYTDGDGNHHSNFVIYSPLPWPPNPSTDKFYVSMQAPVDISTGYESGFPYVPTPQASA